MLFQARRFAAIYHSSHRSLGGSDLVTSKGKRLLGTVHGTHIVPVPAGRDSSPTLPRPKAGARGRGWRGGLVGKWEQAQAPQGSRQRAPLTGLAPRGEGGGRGPRKHSLSLAAPCPALPGQSLPRATQREIMEHSFRTLFLLFLNCCFFPITF